MQIWVFLLEPREPREQKKNEKSGKKEVCLVWVLFCYADLNAKNIVFLNIFF